MDGKMLILEVLIAFALLLQSTSTAVTDSVFRNRMSQGNTVYSGHLLFESPARSRLNCLVMCSLAKCCVRFTYTGMRGNPGTCRGHSTQNFPSEAGVNVDRTAMYVWTGLREVDGEPSNLALNKAATQSTDWISASKANDGDFNAVHVPTSACSHTHVVQGQASWWQVDLGQDAASFEVISVIITNRADAHWHRLRDFDVHVYTENPSSNPSALGNLCSHYDGPMGGDVAEELVCCNGPIRGRYVRVTNTPSEYLTLCEVQVMSVPAM